MTRTLTLAGAVFALSLTGCDDKKDVSPTTPIAPVAQPAAPAEPPRPAEPAAEPHAANPVKPAEDKAAADPGTPPVDAPPQVQAPAEVKDKAAKGLETPKPAEARMGNKVPPPVPEVVEAPAATGARSNEVQPAAPRPGRALPAALAGGTDAGK